MQWLRVGILAGRALRERQYALEGKAFSKCSIHLGVGTQLNSFVNNSLLLSCSFIDNLLMIMHSESVLVVPSFFCSVAFLISFVLRASHLVIIDVAHIAL